MFLYKGKLKLFDHSYSKKLSKMIQEEYEIGIKPSNHKNISYKLEKFLILSGVSDVLDIINSILSLIESIFYVISTYTFPEVSSSQITINKNIQQSEIIFLVYFMAHFALRFYCSQNKILFLLNIVNFIDLASSICLILAQQDFSQDQSSQYFFRMFRIFRLGYLARLEHIVQKKTEERMRLLYRIIINSVTILFIVMAVFLELENNNIRENYEPRELLAMLTVSDILKFHDVVYYMIISISTVGFGDITPISNPGKIVICLLIAFAIPYLEIIRSEIEKIFSLTSTYSLKKYKKKKSHLFLIGNCGPESYETCLQELYNEDHGDIDFDTIIMQLKSDEKMLKMLNNKKYKDKIIYLEGDVFNNQDLERAKAYDSECVIILANKLNNQKNEDLDNIFKAIALQKNAIKNVNSNIRIYIQLLQPESKETYHNSLSNFNEETSQIICLEELKLQILGKSCHCQGINTIITALTTSEKPSINIVKEIPYYSDWMEEYLNGLENEIYKIKIRCEYLHNLTFNDLVKIIYELTNFIVIGTDVIFQGVKPFVCLNPANYLFSPFDHSIYLLASKQPNESEINQLLENYLESHKKGIIKSNIKMVKVKRLKVSEWVNLNRDYERIKKGGDEEDKDNDKNNKMNYFKNKILENKLKININNRNNENNFINIRNFFIQIRPRTQTESENFSVELLENHIIICGLNPNIKHMIIPLRSKSNSKIFPILIIDQNEHIPSQIWTEIQYFPDIYYMKGDLKNKEYIIKAGVGNALAVIILAKYNSNNYEQPDMLDMNSIFIYSAIKRMYNKALVIADLISVNSIDLLLRKSENLEKYGFWLNQAFSSGELYINNMLDTLICQAFYNPYIVNIISQLILGESSFKFPEEIMNKLNRDKLLKSSLNLYKVKELMENYKFESNDNNDNSIEKNKISFNLLFQYLLDKNILPIGILRNFDGIHKFVFLAPEESTEINIEKDEIYVLSSKEVSGLENINKDYYEKYSIELIEKTNARFNELTEKMEKDNKEMHHKLKKDINIKELIHITRTSLRDNFIKVNKKVEEKIMKTVETDFRNNTDAIKEDSNEINIDDSEYNENSASNK